MKAAILETLHQPLVFKETATPALGPDEVLVRLKAASLNHRDVWIQKGLYPGIKTPIILGSDGAGTVTALGEGVESQWMGKEVIINPSHNWGDNPNYYGPDHKILGLPDHGTFAQYCAIKTRYLAEKPAHLSFEEAAALPMAALTAWRALISRVQLQATDKVLITGAGGGVALTAIQLAVASGAEVWVTSGSDEKIKKAIGLGAKGGVNYNNPTWFRDLLVSARSRKEGYFSVILDSAGGAGFARLVDVAAPGARICMYGGTTGPITGVVPARVFFKQLTIYGSTMGTEKEFADVIRFIKEKELRPVLDQVFDLSDAEKAMRRMDSGRQFGKIILKIE